MSAINVGPVKRGRPNLGLTSEAQKRAFKNWKLRNPEKCKASQQRAAKKWRLKNSDKLKVSQKIATEKWKLRNPEQWKAIRKKAQKKYLQSHKDDPKLIARYKKHSHNWYERNKEDPLFKAKCREKSRIWRLKHKAEVNARRRLKYQTDAVFRVKKDREVKNWKKEHKNDPDYKRRKAETERKFVSEGVFKLPEKFINTYYESRIQKRSNRYDITEQLKEPFRTESRELEIRRMWKRDIQKRATFQAKESHNRNPYAISIRFFERINKYRNYNRIKLNKQSCHICRNAINDLMKGSFCNAGLWLLTDSFFLEHRCGCFRRIKGGFS